MRMNVNTHVSIQQWKNVGITGYAKVSWAASPSNHLDWYAKGGRHSDEAPSERSAA